MHKIKTLLFSALLLSCASSFAQKDSLLIKKITSEFCTEFSKKDFTKLKGSEMELGLLVVPIIEKYSKQIEKEWNLSAENEADYEKISEKIGQHAAIGCPKFLEFISNNLEDIESASDEEETKTISGEFQRLDEQSFSTLVIKTKTGKEEKFWWFSYFEGSDQLVNNKTALAKKNVTVKYTEMEVYDPKLKDYRNIKVVKNLSIN